MLGSVAAALLLWGCTAQHAATGITATPSAALVRDTATALPPTRTATARPQLPTATPSPPPRLFTEDFSAGSPGWTFLQASAGQEAAAPGVSNGFLRFDLPAPNQWLYEIYPSQRYSDVRLDAQVELGANGQAAAGLICRYDPAAGWYEFNVYADQTYTLLFGQWLTNGVAHYTPLVIDKSEKIAPSTNEIGLQCQGDILTPYINGVQLRRRQEKLHVLEQGQVGISASSFEDSPLVILYDWVSVSQP